MSEQDELLLTEIKEILIKPLKVSYQQFADEAMVQGAINQAEEILAKTKQHYEQKIRQLESDAEYLANRVKEAESLEQKRLDRPELRELIGDKINECVNKQSFTNQDLDQILALIPDIEEAKKQRDIQWVKFLMHEKHYMSDIPPVDYGQALQGLEEG